MKTRTRVFVVAGVLALLNSEPCALAQPVAEPASQGAPQVDLQVASPGATTSKASADQAKLLEEPEDPLRDPFWPIGYAPVAAQAVGPSAPSVTQPETIPQPTREWDKAQQSISIKGIIRSGNHFLANINNQLVGENEHVVVMFGGEKYSWTITSISAKKVLFKPDMDDAATDNPEPQQ